MGYEGALFTIAEMAIGVAGFSAIVAAFTGQGPLTPKDRRRFIWLFFNAFAAALLSFVPTIFGELPFSESDLWRCSSGLMCFVWFVSAAAWTVGEVRERAADPSEARGVWQRPVALVPQFLNLPLQLCNSFGFFWEPSGAAYTAGALLWLYAGALTFVSIVLERPE